MKLSVIGTGMIATEVLQMIQQTFSNEIELVSIYARPKSAEKAEMLAQRFGIARICYDYDELLKDESEFVYVANVNSVHYEYSRKALLAGKNVIVEKPFCNNSAETIELIQLAEEKQLYLFEAVSLLHMPNWTAIKEQLPQLGPVHLIQCSYCQYSSRYNRYLNHDIAPVFNPSLSGGALRDLNIYNLNFVVSLFGEPQAATYSANLGYNGIDTSGVAILRYPHFVATCSAAKDCGGPNFTTIYGEKGWLRVSQPNEFREFEVCIDGKVEKYSLNQYDYRLCHEFADFLQIYQQKDYNKMKSYLDITLQVMHTVDRLLQS